MKVQRKVYITLEVEFDDNVEVDSAYNHVDMAIEQGLDKIENWIFHDDRVQSVEFTDVEYK